MKLFLCLILCFSFQLLAAETTISGKVLSSSGCAKKTMVWLSLDKENYHERLLLMHTEVPQGGTFEFYVKPGDYQVRVSDDEGCEYLKKVSIKDRPVSLSIQMVKK